MSLFRQGAAQVMERCRELAAITDVPGETTRTFLSPAMRRANDLVATWMSEAGLTVRIDAAGNLRGRREGASAAAKTLVLGSHLDTVPNAGAYDGVLGVVMALAVAEETRNLTLPIALEIIAFSEEEGVRFGLPFIGSRAVAGSLDDALLSRTDRDGVSVRDAIRAYGLDHVAMPSATMQSATMPSATVHDALGYFEFHIEQGPVLEAEGLPLGVVEAIVGQSRFEVVFTGHANHAGTTPMRLRHDAMAAAAEWIAEVERYASASPMLVATVGIVQTFPGAGNVIAGEVRASLDVRSPRDDERADAVAHLLEFAQQCSSARGVTAAHTERMQQAAVPMDRGLMRVLEDAVDSTGALVYRMVSGAGHDAMIVAAAMPAAMLFLRTPGGLSHHPDEAVLPADVQLGLHAGVAFVRALAAGFASGEIVS